MVCSDERDITTDIEGDITTRWGVIDGDVDARGEGDISGPDQDDTGGWIDDIGGAENV